MIDAYVSSGRDSVVGLATVYGPEAPGIEFRRRRDIPVCPDRPEVHPASFTMGTGPFPGGEGLKRCAGHTHLWFGAIIPPPLSACICMA
jgi:hypothetical protein